MSSFLDHPLGRELLRLLTAHHGSSGHRREVFLEELDALRIAADDAHAPASVKGAIRSALRALRAAERTAGPPVRPGSAAAARPPALALSA